MSCDKMTIAEIKERLTLSAPDEAWIQQLKTDSRRGVQQILKRWFKQQEEERKLKEQWQAMVRFEQQFYEQGLFPIAGVDEAGRGPIAGPVVAAAVILPQDAYIPGLNDSKTLSPHRRKQLYDAIIKTALDYSVAIVSPEKIDELNIYQATIVAMTEAVNRLNEKPKVLLNDAVHLPTIQTIQKPIIGGDRQSVSIAAASIVAKVTRDKIMLKFAERYPQYGFERHMGYATVDHMDALYQYGPTVIHRHSFAPVRKVLDRT